MMLSEILAVSNLQNANAAEPMTALGIYVHAFFLILVLGLAPLVLLLEFLAIRKKDDEYKHGAKIMSQVWAVSFAFGAATGTFVEFGLYLIWPGTILAISSFWFIPFIFDLFAFLIEVGFLLAYLHFWDRINRWLHWLLGWGLMIGSLFSAVAILPANSWLSVPWGTGNLVHKILPWVPTLGPNSVNATAFATLSQTAANTGVFNLASPSSANALGFLLYNPLIVLASPDGIVTDFHSILGAIIVACFETAAIFSYNYLRGGKVNRKQFYLKIMKVAYGMGSIAMFAQAFAGDQMARMVYLFQKLQFVTFEGIPSKGGVDPIIGLLLSGNANRKFPGYDYYGSLASQSTQPSAVTQSVATAQQLEPLLHLLYYTMAIGGGILLIFSIAYFGLYSKKLDRLVRLVTRLPTEKFVIYTSFIAPVVGLAAGGSGWAIREIGRHPWTVYGLIEYSQVVTPSTITPQFTALIMILESALLIGGLLALYFVPTRALERDEEQLVVIRG